MPKLIEIKSWLPEHNTGLQVPTLAGHTLPSRVGTTMRSPWRVLCLAPAEWLLISENAPPKPDSRGLVLTDVTDGVAVLNVRGPLALDVLSKGCGLDFEPRAFPLGSCARTRFGQMSVIVERVDDKPAFDLYVARSYCRFLSDWLKDAAVEFVGSPPQSRG